jgi:hypothetical protein
MTRRILIFVTMVCVGSVAAVAARGMEESDPKTFKTADKDADKVKDKDKDKDGVLSVPDGDPSSAVLLGLGLGSVMWAASSRGRSRRRL